MKIYSLLFSLLIILFVEKVNAQAGLIACYPLDNNTNDQSGNNYNGTAFNLTAAADRFGNPNSAYHFSGVNSYIDLPSANFLLDTFTYSAWCKLTSLPTTGHYYSIISIGGSLADQAILIANDSAHGNTGFGAASWDSNTLPHSCNQDTLPLANQWYHVVMTRTNTVLNFYINGSLTCSTSIGNTTAGYQSIISALIGSRASTSGQNFVGDIDDVRIFDRALTLSEIQNMPVSCQSSAPCLVACYPLDNNANDLSGNNYDGTLHNVTVTFDRFGNPNSAYHFSGSGSYIDLPSADFLLDSFTYSAWCKPSSIPAVGHYYSIISIGGSLADQAILLANDSTHGNVGFGAASWSSSIIPYDCNQDILPIANQWYHLVMTRTNSTMNIYINDTLSCSTVLGNTTAGYLTTVTALIGSRAGTTGQDFIGDIDDVRIFNCVLSQNEIKNMGASCIITGIDLISKIENTFIIYPNPLTTFSILQFNTPVKDAEVSIYDLLGKEMLKKKLTGNRMEIEKGNLENGIYFVRVSDARGENVQKLIVQ